MAGSSEWNFSEMPIGLVVIAELAGLAVAIPSAMFIDHGERNESPLQPIHDERPVKQQQTVD